MSNRRDIFPLIRDALAASSPTTLSGENGLTGTVEISADGHSRRVEILRDGEPEYLGISSQTDAERPEFWPDDIPFLEGAIGTIGAGGAYWQLNPAAMTRKAGDLKALEEEFSQDEEVQAFQESVEAMGDALKNPDAMREVLKAMPESLRSRLADLFGGSETDQIEIWAGRGLPMADRVVGELEAMGWTVDSVDDETDFKRSWWLSRDGLRRMVGLISANGQLNLSLSKPTPADPA